ncbi:hypothetical protein OWM54_43010 [Myxococcus sp. MISCRS1]|uniref:hypothetical protein n=1 Tax=Myxococcus sp. MISCRS1 TaxID=2996786 RepID=UPI00226DADC2|nr:hypothetical protein [Myxococcus sp. MISCRS1]MCY1003936.1 hypothetical protein [Myxococcus sp. MISCRS1]
MTYADLARKYDGVWFCRNCDFGALTEKVAEEHVSKTGHDLERTSLPGESLQRRLDAVKADFGQVLERNGPHFIHAVGCDRSVCEKNCGGRLVSSVEDY